MAELGGIVLGYAVGKLLDELLSTLSHLKNKSANSSRLQNLLERLKPSVEVLELKIVVGDENDLAAKWLTAVRKQFGKAHELINKSGGTVSNPSIIKRYCRSRSKGFVKVHRSIHALLQEASALQWASELRIQSALIDNDATTHGKLDQMLQKLSNLAIETTAKFEMSECVAVETILDSHHAHSQSNTSAERNLSDRALAYEFPAPPVTFVGVNTANEIIDHVINKEYRKWLALWGMGGVGKTSTASLVYAEDRIKRHFSAGRYWITVNKDQVDSRTRIFSLFRQLEKKIQGEKYPSELPDDLWRAKSYIASLLADARVLLVLDDVWQDNELKYLDVVSGSSNSVILVTTRDQGILRGIIHDAQCHIFEIEKLSERHSWQLFSWHAFSGREISHEVERVAKEVAQECRGLPLALEVVGSTMAHKQLQLRDETALGISPLRAWRKALQDLKCASTACAHEYEALYRMLQLSVDGLQERDPRLRDCFLYFAAFPEDQDISVEKLASLWDAEGLVEDNETGTLSGQGQEAKELLGVLATRCMIKVTKPGRHSKVRVHDVMRHVAQLNHGRDFASNQDIQASARECLYAPCLRMSALPREWTVLPTCAAKRLSLQDNDFQQFPELEQFLAPHLLVLNFSNNVQLWSLSPEFCENLPNLRVLDLQRTGIKRIPGELLKRLQSLKYLDLSWCQQLREISDEIAGSRNLKYFYIVGCFKLRRLPLVEQLTNLKVYATQQLTCSTVLKHGDKDEATDPSRRSKRDLSRYQLPPNLTLVRISRKRAEPPCCRTSTESLCIFDVSSLRGLRELTLDHVSPLPEGIFGLRHLKILKIHGSHRAASISMPLLGKLPLLEELSLRLRFVDGGSSLSVHEGSFPSLRRFRISCLSSMEKFFSSRVYAEGTDTGGRQT